MIKKLHRKLILIVMSVVTMILLAIFFTMLLTTQQNNERMSIDALHQAFNVPPASGEETPPIPDRNPSPTQRPDSQMRLPVLIVETDKEGNVELVSNQLHFIAESEIEPITQQALSKADDMGTLSSYALRYLKNTTDSGTQIAFIDITMEQEILKTQIVNSLLIGGSAILCFFILSLFLARWRFARWRLPGSSKDNLSPTHPMS